MIKSNFLGLAVIAGSFWIVASGAQLFPLGAFLGSLVVWQFVKGGRR